MTHDSKKQGSLFGHRILQVASFVVILLGVTAAYRFARLEGVGPALVAATLAMIATVVFSRLLARARGRRRLRAALDAYADREIALLAALRRQHQ